MGRAAALIAALAVVPAAFSTLALAHHGWSEYDSSKPLKVAGTIVESGYGQPHGHLRLQESGGKAWTVVLAPPSRMEHRGLSKDMLRKGISATVEGYPSRSKPDEMRAERITIKGKTVELR